MANKGWTTTLPGPGQSEGRGAAPGSDSHDLLGHDLPGRGVDFGGGPGPGRGVATARFPRLDLYLREFFTIIRP